MAGGEQAVRCGAETCSHCKKQQEEGEAERFPGGAQSSAGEQSKEAGWEERLVVIAFVSLSPQ